MKKLFPTVGMICLMLLTACNAESSVTVKDIYAYATSSAQKNGAIFMTVENAGSQADKIIAAENAEIAQRIELHTHSMDSGMMSMYQVEAFEVSNGTKTLEPMGDHIMLIGLKKQLKIGDTVPLTLTFEKAGTIDIVANVIAAGTKPE